MTMAEERHIAIVGIGCRFPGADDIDEFWHVLLNGENHVTDIPNERWRTSAFFDKDPDASGKTYVTKAGLVKNFNEWDNQVYGINDIEAERIDPQQRFVLDCVSMAMEDGGITRDDLNASDTGVYIGTMNSDFKDSLVTDPTDMTNYSLTGVSTGIIAARVSYVFNLLGPALTLDTACSSALVAVYTGSQAILADEVDMAVCGGVSLIMGPEPFIALSRARMIGRTGQCQAFSEDADGYARGEGCGIVILKEYSKALSDGNKIWGIIKTACNQDGRTVTPMTAPSSSQQMALLEKIYRKYDFDPASVQYIEAHGTGTPIGDPVEGNALGTFFSKTRRPEHSSCTSNSNGVKIGSVKTNIGHLEPAAGVAGLIKVLLMMKHGQYVPSLFCKKTNPKIEFERHGLELCQDICQWTPAKSGNRSACINSFGFGGTNAHAIVTQQATANPARHERHESSEPKMNAQVVTVSAASLGSLTKGLHNLRESLLEKEPSYSLAELSYTSTCRRSHLPLRQAFCEKNKQSLAEAISLRLQSVDVPFSSKPKRLIFVFCGVGTVWQGMCQELMKEERIFHDTVRTISSILEPLLGWSVLQKLEDGENTKEDPLLGHIAIYTSQVALLTLWKHYGITPNVVVGQSVGEVAAALAAGIVTLEESALIIYHRATILSKMTGGKMVVVAYCQTSVAEELCQNVTTGKASVSVYTSPFTTVLAGDEQAILEIKEKINMRNKYLEKPIVIMDLEAKCAYHSQHVEDSVQLAREKFNFIKGTKPSIPIISTVTGKTAADGDFTTAEYWGRNMRNTVHFHKAISEAADPCGHNIFLEIGPRQVLRSHMKDIFPTTQSISLPSMGVNDEVECVRGSLAKLYEFGYDIKWNNVVKRTDSITTQPKYQFNRRSILHEGNKWKLTRQGTISSSGHSFITRLGGTDATFSAFLSPSTTPLLYKHIVDSTPIVPGSLHAEIGLEVAKQVYKCSCFNLEISTEIHRPLILSAGKEYELHIETMEEEDLVGKKSLVFKVYAEALIATGTARYTTDVKGTTAVDLTEIKRRCCHFYTGEDNYRMLKSFGFHYEDDLKVLHDAVTGDKECLVEFRVTDAIMKELNETNIHPSVLDGLLQSSGALIGTFGHLVDKIILPAGVEQLVLRQPLQREMLAYTCVSASTEFALYFDLLLMAPTGVVIAELSNYTIQILDPSSDRTNPNTLALDVSWKKLPSESENCVGPTTTRQSTDALVSDIMILSFCPKHIEELTQMLHGSNTKTVLLSTKGNNKVMIKENLNNSTKSSFTSVVYSPGFDSRQNPPVTGTGLMQQVESSCRELLTLVLELVELEVDIPLHVVTFDVYNDGLSENEGNLFGAELHGFVKALLKEQLYERVSLIDVETGSNTPLLKQILLDDMPESFRDERIVRLARKKCFAMNIHLTPPTAKPAIDRDVAFDPCLKLDILFRKEDVFHFQIEHGNLPTSRRTEGREGQAEVIVEIATFPEHLWTANLSFEIQGTLVVPSKTCDDNETDFDDRCSGGEVVACYPVALSSKVCVPKSCLVLKEELPLYFPGLLLQMQVLWTLMDNIQIGSRILILYLEESRLIVYLLAALLQLEKECNVKTMNCSESGETVDNETFDVYIPVGSTLCYLEQLLFRQHDGERTVLLVRQQRDDFAAELQRMRMSLIATTISVLELDAMFSVSNILTKMPHALQWLKGQNGTIAEMIKIHNGRIENGLPSPSMSIQTTSHVFNSERTVIRAGEDDLFHKHACYILVGGLTGLGWELLKVMARKGAGVLVSLARRSPDEKQVLQINKVMEDHRCVILPIQADICDMASLDNAYKIIRASFKGPVKGIFHGGGSSDNTLAVHITEDLLTKILSPKVLGTWNLHEWSLREDLPLDFFVTHSSISSILGNEGQACYSAANAFMDAFAFYRRMQGRPSQTINWGALNLGMMTEFLSKTTGATPEYVGDLKLLSTPEIERCFLHALTENSTQSIYAGFKNKTGISQPSSVTRPSVQSSTTMQVKQFVQKTIANLKLCPNHGGIEFEYLMGELSECVTLISSEVFAISKELITPDTDFLSLGLDSMLGMTFINRIFELFRIRIPVVKLLAEGSTVNSIADFLSTEAIKRFAPSTQELPSQPRRLSLLGQHKYAMYEEDPSDPSQILLFDLHVPKPVANADTWRSNFQYQLQNNASLRNVYVRDQNDKACVHIHTIPSSEAVIDFRLVDEEDINHSQRLPSDPSQYSFNLDKEFAFRILFAYTSDGSAIIRMIFHLTGFDLGTVNMLLEDMSAYGNHRINGGLLPKQRQTVDVHTVFESYLESRRPVLEEFWKDAIPPELKGVTLAQQHTGDHSKYAGFQNTVREFNSTEFKRLIAFLQDNKVTLFNYVVGVYQLALHRRTGKPWIPVLSNVDMRQYIPELSEAMAWCLNLVPLVAEMTPHLSLGDFIHRNCEKNRQHLLHSQYPLVLLLSGLQSEESKSALTKHGVIQNDLGFSSILKRFGSETFSVRRITHGNLHMETVMFIEVDLTSSSLRLDLLHNASLIGENRGDDLMDDVAKYVRNVTDLWDNVAIP